MMLNFKIISLLCCVAIVSVGFASWIITGVTIDNNATTGNFTAYSSTDNGITITDGDTPWISGLDENFVNGSQAAATGSVVFGKSATPATGTEWLKASGAMLEDSLRLSYTFTVSGTASFDLNFKIIDYVGATFTPGTTASSGKLKALVDSGAIALPTLTLYKGTVTEQTKTNASASSLTDGYVFNDLSGAGTYILIIEYKWGTACGNTNLNPFDYFNDLAFDATEYSQGNPISYKDSISDTGAIAAGTTYGVANQAANALLNDVYRAFEGATEDNAVDNDDLKFALYITGTVNS